VVLKTSLVHNHEVVDWRMLIENARDRIRNLARKMEEKPRTIISRVMTQLPTNVAAANLPSFESIGRSIRHMRHQVRTPLTMSN
jgi:hypothetical protein